MGQSLRYTAMDRIEVLGSRAQAVSDCVTKLFGALPQTVVEALPALISDLTRVVVLTDSQPASIPAAGAWVLNLEDIGLVRLSHEISAPVTWFSAGDARRQLGPLVEALEGTYWDAVQEQWITQSAEDRSVYPGHAVGAPHELRFAMSAAIAALTTVGVPAKALGSAVENLVSEVRGEFALTRARGAAEAPAAGLSHL